MVVKIKDLPLSERPYEKLVSRGPESLSTEELIAVLLKTGYQNISSKELSSILLKEAKGVVGVSQMSYEQLLSIKGIGMSKACILLASIEFSNRIEAEKVKIIGKRLTNSQMVYEYYKNKISNKKQEYFYVVYLDNFKKIINDKLLFIGTINHSVVHPREIFKEAYMLSASAIICVHNHPTGNIFPSKEDINITNNLVQIGTLLGIKMVDHIIIGKEQYYSFLENNDIERN